MVQALMGFKRSSKPVLLPSLAADEFLGRDPLLGRCGRPFLFDQERDKSCLFFDHPHLEYDEMQSSADIS